MQMQGKDRLPFTLASNHFHPRVWTRGAALAVQSNNARWETYEKGLWRDW